MSDHPFEVIIPAVVKVLSQGHHFYQKWTCRHCGSRQTMAEPDTLFESGRCEECKRISIINKCNYVLMIGINTEEET